MATITTTDIKFSKTDLKSKANPVLNKNSVNQILESLLGQNPQHYIAWADLIEQLELHFELSKVEAAVYVRQLVNDNKLHEVPCHLSGLVVFTKDKSLLASQVKATAEDERMIAEQDRKYLAQLESNVREQRRQASARRYEKDRKEMLSRK